MNKEKYISILEAHFELVNNDSSFSHEDPIPIAAVLFDEELNPLHSEMNSLTLGVPCKEKFDKHAETKVIRNFENISKLSNLGLLVSIPPCPDCYRVIASTPQIEKIYYITSIGSGHKFYRRNSIIKKENLRLIEFEEFPYAKEYSKEHQRIWYKNIIKWVKNSN